MTAEHPAVAPGCERERLWRGDHAASGDRTQECGGWLGGAHLIGAVDGDQPELHPVAEGPLEIVERRPVDVPPQRDPFGDHLVERSQCGGDELDSLLVAPGGDAMLGDQQVLSWQELRGAAHRGRHGLGTEFVAHVGPADVPAPVAPPPAAEGAAAIDVTPKAPAPAEATAPVEENAPVAELFTQDPILLDEVLDDPLLFAVDPADDGEQQDAQAGAVELSWPLPDAPRVSPSDEL